LQEGKVDHLVSDKQIDRSSPSRTYPWRHLKMTMLSIAQRSLTSSVLLSLSMYPYSGI